MGCCEISFIFNVKILKKIFLLFSVIKVVQKSILQRVYKHIIIESRYKINQNGNGLRYGVRLMFT